jgi:2-C-methyl-D-erythritol 2,4-cyclodiphosphate synthase
MSSAPEHCCATAPPPREHRLHVRIGHGFDAHRLVEGRRLILGGVDVAFERGAFGHSDADVLAHALADALLGAAALGDLGARFPDTDPRWKDANSMELLATCAREVRNAGFGIANVDATIVIDRPKLETHVARMRANVADRLSIAPHCVSVKAKTSEGMGYTGDGSGIAVYAVALLTENGVTS